MNPTAGWVTGGLALANQILAATIVLTSFSLLIYLLTHNIRSLVARAFCRLLLFVLVVYIGDVALVEATAPPAATHWLKFQWTGIALVPAAYLSFSDALLRATHERIRWRRAVVWISYAVSFALLGLVFATELVVTDGVYAPNEARLAAGPLFWIFALYFVLTVLWGAATVRRARRRCLTRASRRRMTYLGLAFAAPALGVFPYLMLAGAAASFPRNGVLLLLLVGNVAVLLMLVLMTYSVAYFGALTPDRVIRHNLLHYLMRGPLVGAAVIFTMLAVPKVEAILGLPRDTVLIFTVVGVIVLLQLAINQAKPFIDRAVYREDQEEIGWIQTLDRRLLTSTDLDAFLENVLAALCDLLQVRTGFVAAEAGGQHRLEAHCGDRETVLGFLEGHDLSALAASTESRKEEEPLAPGNGFWLRPLFGKTNEAPLAVLGVEARNPEPDLTPDEREMAMLLIGRAEEALDDRYLQQSVFDTLRHILPDIERLHQWQGVTRYGVSPPMHALPEGALYSAQFQKWVREALGHYWGGPKLTESPLIELEVVQAAIQAEGSSPAQGLRAVLRQAIERLRPRGDQKMTASEWLLYNILEMKYIRGLKVHDMARRLAVSESDLYRKQRVAIAEVARALAELEQTGVNKQ